MKVLLTESNLMEYVDREHQMLFMKPEYLITPGAKDALRIKNIRISYDEAPLCGSGEEKKEEASTVPAEKEDFSIKQVSKEKDLKLPEEMPLEHVIKQILRKQYGIVREEEVCKISSVVLQLIEMGGLNQ